MNNKMITATVTKPTISWLQEQVIEKWESDRLLRVKSLIEQEILHRTMRATRGLHATKKGN